MNYILDCPAFISIFSLTYVSGFACRFMLQVLIHGSTERHPHHTLEMLDAIVR